MDIKVGMRIVCDNEYCTVRYIGKVDGTEGEWIGVEWDNPSRGKHNGNYNGVKYFSTREPTSGSFVREKKVSLGMSCAEAIRNQYGVEPNAIESIIPQSTLEGKKDEFVGFEQVSRKQSEFDKLERAALTNMPVNSAGLDNELSQLTPNLRELYLTHTLLSSWTEVSEITKQLPNLSLLDLSSNQLDVPENPEELQPSFQQIEFLVLNKIGYNWNQVLTCGVMWKSVRSLILCSNQIETLEIPQDEFFYHLEVLDLSYNSIGSWSEVCKLGHLPKLSTLNLIQAGITNVRFDGVDPTCKTKYFSSLKKLNVSDNNLKEWRDVAELNKLPDLQELIVTNNPVMMLENFDTTFQCIIAKIDDLKKLNKMQITAKIRRHAEIDYLKRYYKQWKEYSKECDSMDQNTSLDFLSEHPRYLKLIETYGLPEESEVKEKSSLLKNRLISVKIYSPSLPERPCITRKLPNTMTIGKVKALVRRLFQASADPQLTCKNSEDDDREVELDNDLRELDFFSVSNGDIICAKW